MERLSKRPRLYSSRDSELTHSYDEQLQYYDTPATEVDDDEFEEPVFDPAKDLQRRRARLDRKLKSTFEAIFDKYEKDFGDVGDEIDLLTGEILVNNGHLLRMQHERDAGSCDRGTSQSEEGSELEIGDSDHLESSSVENELDGGDEDEDDEDDDEDEEDDSEEDDEASSKMGGADDDLILRGFAQASQHLLRQPSSVPESSTDGYIEPVEVSHPKSSHRMSMPNVNRSQSRSRPVDYPRPVADRDVWRPKDVQLPQASRRTKSGSVLPSREEILSQFGPQLGPEILQYVKSRERATTEASASEGDVEAAWRVPRIPQAPVRRPKSRHALEESDTERSASPEHTGSIWASSWKTKRGPRKWFTEEEDQLMLDHVANARRNGLKLTTRFWKQLAAMHPRHNWDSYKNRFNRFARQLVFEFPAQNTKAVPPRETEAFLSTAVRHPINAPRPAHIDRDFRPNSDTLANHEARVYVPKSTRIRKPAQNDPSIVTWSDAVATIEAIDPQGYAELLKDAREANGESSFSSAQSQSFDDSVTGAAKPSIRKQVHSRPDMPSGTEDELAAQHEPAVSKLFSPKRASCPHTACRHDRSTRYRLDRRSDEELSPMCVHLQRVHRTTPYPCVEYNCDRTGEDGFFEEEDLVQHVKDCHPYATALQRLRSRVDERFLDQTTRDHVSKTMGPPRTPGASPQIPNPMSHERAGLALNARVRAAHDKTLGSRSSERASSLMVNPPSAKEKKVDLDYDSDIQILSGNPFSGKQKMDRPFPCPLAEAMKCKRIFSNRSNALLHATVHAKTPPAAELETASKAVDQAVCPYPDCRMMIDMAQQGAMVLHLKWHVEGGSQILASSPPALPRQSSIPDSQSSMRETISSPLRPQTHRLSDRVQKISSPSPNHSAILPTKPSVSQRGFTRPIVDASYNFSDEEDSQPVQKPKVGYQKTTGNTVSARSSVAGPPGGLLDRAVQTVRGFSATQPQAEVKTPEPIAAALPTPTISPREVESTSKTPGNLASKAAPGLTRSGDAGSSIRPPASLPSPARVKPVQGSNNIVSQDKSQASKPQVASPLKFKPAPAKQSYMSESASTPRSKVKAAIQTKPAQIVSQPSIGTLKPVVEVPHAPLTSSKADPPVSNNAPASKQPLATPAPKVKQAHVLRSIETDDFDELSLEQDELVLLSVGPRIGPPLRLAESAVKREDAHAYSAPSRKRRYSMMESSDEIDELMGDESLLPNSSKTMSTKKPRIGLKKEEVDTPTGPAHIAAPPKTAPGRLKATQTSKLKPSLSDGMTSSDKIAQPIQPPQIALVTAATTAAPAAHVAQGSPILGPSTPLRRLRAETMKRENDDLMATPGGTLRRCGEDGFVCARSFCFLCGSAGGR